MIFDKFTYDKLTLPSIIIFAVGGSSMFFPYYRIFGGCASKLKCYETKGVEVHTDSPYNDFRINFFTEYDRVNPITSDDAVKEYITSCTVGLSHQT